MIKTVKNKYVTIMKTHTMWHNKFERTVWDHLTKDWRLTWTINKLQIERKKGMREPSSTIE